MLSFASWTFGWSNGLISSAQPATATANSVRKKIRPRSAGPWAGSVIVGCPARPRSARSRRPGAPRAARGCAGTRTPGRRRRHRRCRRAARRRSGRSRGRACRSIPATSCSPIARSSRSAARHECQLVPPLARELADRGAEPQAGVRLARVVVRARLLGDLAAVQQRLDADAHQRRRDEPEVRQHRVAAADVGRVEEAAAQPVVVGEALERAPGVGDRDELLGAGQRVEIVVLRERLDRRPGLGRDDEQRLLEVDRVLHAERRRRGGSSRARSTGSPPERHRTSAE